jgi:hypothetical protein
MTDDEILEAIDRRFASVETRLPPTRVMRSGGQVRGTTMAGGTFRAVPIPVVVLVVVALGAGIAATRPPATLPGAEVTASPSSPGLAVASATPAATSSPSAEPLLILRGSSTGDALLIEHFRWGPCLVGSDGSIVAPDLAAIDRVIDDTGVVDGWVEVPLRLTKVPTTMRYWVAPTPESAARGYGAGVLAIGGRGSTWIEVGGRGQQLISFQTPKGRTFWMLLGSVADRSC